MLPLITLILIVWILLSYKKTIIYRNIFDRANIMKRVNAGELVEIEPIKTPYLIRYTILSCRYFSIKIHKALISDSDEPHDHPWNYLSIILWGGYWEERYDNVALGKKIYKWYKPGSILYRRGDKLHKLIIPQDKYCISFIFTSKKWRTWGYINSKKEWNKYEHQ